LKAALIKCGLHVADADRKSAAGRKTWDEVLIFKALFSMALYNLPDDQEEYQLRDRLSFVRFLGLSLEDEIPDAKTLWLYREALAKAGAVEELFERFDRFLKDKRVSGHGRPDHRCDDRVGELWLNLGDGVDQAADLISCAASIPSLNITPSMTFGN
jgi:hypothetical protein